ncbi:MAG TPA: acyl-CoA dehydrogenase family protein [Acidimicrobiia bacterium]|nr:acyl-CoA dehydrogenase family protein [Acidimicrobiia bacterium]
MDLVVPDHIVELGATARRAFADVGGVDLARDAERDPGERQRAADALRALGAFDIDPLEDADQALAAFALCREAGRVALPWPVEATLCRAGGGAVTLVDPADPLVDHADVLDAPFAVDVTGRAWRATVAGPRLGSRLAPFAVPVALEPVDAPVAIDAAATTAWALSAVTVLGYVESAVDLAAEHVRTRRQFDQRIADFQAVQFQVADALVAAAGLAELALFTIWRVAELGAGARTDALALRVHAADVVRSAMRTAQQLHGASGVSDEYDVSVLCRRAQANLRLPVSSERVVGVLVDAIRDEGFASLFPQGRKRVGA